MPLATVVPLQDPLRFVFTSGGVGLGPRAGFPKGLGHLMATLCT